jgi:transcriptional regulator with XRE-family HTH domain
MANRKITLLPRMQRMMDGVGENIRLARLRRGLSGELVAQRAGISRPTLAAIEKGAPGVSIGSYVNVLHALGLAEDISLLAKDDELGRKLQDLGLKTGRRAPKTFDNEG